MRLSFIFALIVLILASCGGGGGGSASRPAGPQTQQPQPPRTAGPQSQFSAIRAATDWRYWWNSPIMRSPSSNAILIGPGVVASELDGQTARELLDAPPHDGFVTAYGRIRNGVGRFQMSSYLSEDAADQGGRLLRWGNEPPTVYVTAGATAEQIAETRAVVGLINSALPQRWQLRFNSQPAPVAETVPVPTAPVLPQDCDTQCLQAFNAELAEFNAALDRAIARPDGRIVVEYSPRATWRHRQDDNAIGLARWWQIDGEITAARVWVDPFENRTQQRRMEVLAHEMLHALGRGHADARHFPYTVTHAVVNDALHVPGYILHQLDNEALLAVYSRMQPGTPAHLVSQDLGPWESESFNVLAIAPPLHGGDPEDLDAHLPGLVMIGASARNGAVRPFAMGHPLPDTALANSGLTGSATWSGRLLGLTTRSEPLAGAAGMTIDLATLQGGLSFTGLETWGANQPPGAVGTGRRWGDGDLDYQIQVRSNSFHRIPGSGSDTGRVEGVFVGHGHERMTGIVDRYDMSAGFGGTRQ